MFKKNEFHENRDRIIAILEFEEYALAYLWVDKPLNKCHRPTIRVNKTQIWEGVEIPYFKNVAVSDEDLKLIREREKQIERNLCQKQ